MLFQFLPATFVTLLLLAAPAAAFTHPIGIHGRYFIDTVTRQPFFLKGIDYQPGGSSAVTESIDPLSDPNTCARDIILFQELNINTIRVYSINPDLDHDVCMSMLASAGIYLVLDVNSPLQGQHMNRYEPWTSYNEDYLEHVFKAIEQFSGYNNTLGFFAGNEIVNDKKSARNSPPFIKNLIKDMKLYIDAHSPRSIPVGYSAADDLNFRVSLSKYLECTDGSFVDSVDFYGVNTYQWCGEQTFYTSGYDALTLDYEDYVRPVFFSEFGCNAISPRVFEEVSSIFGDEMIGVFSGGLVYEYSQEPNNYGLVEIDDKGAVRLMKDFDYLKVQYTSTEIPTGERIAELYNRGGKGLKLGAQALPECEEEYDNLEITLMVDDSISSKLLKNGVDAKRGRFVTIDDNDLYTTYQIYNTDGTSFDRKYVRVTHLLDEITEYEAIRLKQLSNDSKYP
ncbi:hypothetical protein BON22_2603 [Cyberlindnera fabianii]|uniref:1,3-beta-glucanosyltransferase n=1 Tax=Cyberlindnera fabianii TaxID=36022 RepID=A0A1V2L9F9_CYBFA|nr:hypothetical protein BON22_2603 [Cyberlindnera fabianii]